jgi:hypothetical protein
MRKGRPQKVKTDEAWIRKRAEYWKKVLRLQDWEIDIDIVRHYRLESDEMVFGEIWHQPKKKYAHIRICHPHDLAPGAKTDPEGTLVHELVHCHLATWNPGNDSGDTLKEQAIESIASGLIRLERRAVK